MKKLFIAIIVILFSATVAHAQQSDSILFEKAFPEYTKQLVLSGTTEEYIEKPKKKYKYYAPMLLGNTIVDYHPFTIKAGDTMLTFKNTFYYSKTYKLFLVEESKVPAQYRTDAATVKAASRKQNGPGLGKTLLNSAVTIGGAILQRKVGNPNDPFTGTGQ